MAFFDKLNSIAKSLTETTNDVIATTKLNGRINSENAAAGEALRQIGEYYYRVYVAGGEVASEVLGFCESAKAHFDAAASVSAEIDRLKVEQERERAAQYAHSEAVEGIGCPTCGKLNSPGTKFCSECGCKLEAAQENRCPECGALVQQGAKFCASCGHRMEG